MELRLLEGCFLYLNVTVVPVVEVRALAQTLDGVSRSGYSGGGGPGPEDQLSSLREGSQAQVSPRTLCLHPSPEARFNGYSCHHDDSLLGGIIRHHPTLIKELEPGHRRGEGVTGYATGASFQKSRFM